MYSLGNFESYNSEGHEAIVVRHLRTSVSNGLSLNYNIIRDKTPRPHHFLALALDIGQANHLGSLETVWLAALFKFEIWASGPSDGLCSQCSKKDEPELYIYIYMYVGQQGLASYVSII